MDMADLLTDNTKAKRRQVTNGQEGSTSRQIPTRASWREVPEFALAFREVRLYV